MLLSELLKGINILSQYEDREITDVTDKTHCISEGCAFVSVVGQEDKQTYEENYRILNANVSFSPGLGCVYSSPLSARKTPCRTLSKRMQI